METHTEGRPIAESRAAALAALARWDRLAALWDSLLEKEQEAIITLAASLADDDRDV